MGNQIRGSERDTGGYSRKNPYSTQPSINQVPQQSTGQYEFIPNPNFQQQQKGTNFFPNTIQNQPLQKPVAQPQRYKASNLPFHKL